MEGSVSVTFTEAFDVPNIKAAMALGPEAMFNKVMGTLLVEAATRGLDDIVQELVSPVAPMLPSNYVVDAFTAATKNSRVACVSTLLRHCVIGVRTAKDMLEWVLKSETYVSPADDSIVEVLLRDPRSNPHKLLMKFVNPEGSKDDGKTCKKALGRLLAHKKMWQLTQAEMDEAVKEAAAHDNVAALEVLLKTARPTQSAASAALSAALCRSSELAVPKLLLELTKAVPTMEALAEVAKRGDGAALTLLAPFIATSLTKKHQRTATFAKDVEEVCEAAAGLIAAVGAPAPAPVSKRGDVSKKRQRTVTFAEDVEEVCEAAASAVPAAPVPKPKRFHGLVKGHVPAKGKLYSADFLFEKL